MSGGRETGHAEDLSQTALVRLAWRWPTAREAPEAYARRVLLNLSRDRWRYRTRRVAEQLVADFGPVAGADADLAERTTDQQTLLPALRQLPRRQRETVVLRYYADLSVAETTAA